MKVKETAYRMATILCVIGIIGTMGGLEWSMFGFGRWAVQTALFFAGMVVFHKFAEAEHTRRRRKAVK